MQSLGEVDAAQPLQGRSFEVHQQQHLLEREPMYGAELAGKALFEARAGAEQVQGGGKARFGHRPCIGRYASL